MVDFLFFLSAVLFMVTAIVLIKYCKQLKEVGNEYEKARAVIQDIILSFNKQLEGEANNLALVAYKVEALHSKVNNHSQTMEELNKKTYTMEENIGVLMQDKQFMHSKLVELDKKVGDVITLKETLTKRLSDLEEQTKQLSIVPETNDSTVIPIKKEKALAPLTETELMVLEHLALEGPKTAPEIKEKIKLSREHTARLMKKLYQEGYLERNTSKIPFKYSVKKEMGSLLAKKEENTA